LWARCLKEAPQDVTAASLALRGSCHRHSVLPQLVADYDRRDTSGSFGTRNSARRPSRAPWSGPPSCHAPWEQISRRRTRRAAGARWVRVRVRDRVGGRTIESIPVGPSPRPPSRVGRRRGALRPPFPPAAWSLNPELRPSPCPTTLSSSTLQPSATPRPAPARPAWNPGRATTDGERASRFTRGNADAARVQQLRTYYID